jgi:hypothetical protein
LRVIYLVVVMVTYLETNLYIYIVVFGDIHVMYLVVIGDINVVCLVVVSDIHVMHLVAIDIYKRCVSSFCR